MDEGKAEQIDTSTPHSARIYDYYLGGKNHFAADREVGDKMISLVPTVRTAARENRAFLGRAVRYLTADAGVRQFLDIGTGLPATGSVHEIAQRTDPRARVVYADNDPLVMAHARALLTSSPEGRTGYIQADLRDPAAILNDPATRGILDFTEPVALMLVAILHFLPDEEKPREAIAALLDALPSGSYLVATHATQEYVLPEMRTADDPQNSYRNSGIPLTTRDTGEFGELAFDGLDLVPPGVVVVTDWRPEGTGPRPMPWEANFNAGVARKP